jgi:hypothetical protein
MSRKALIVIILIHGFGDVMKVNVKEKVPLQTLLFFKILCQITMILALISGR